MRKFREGFKERFDGASPQESKVNLETAIKDAVDACKEECPTNKSDCPDKSECSELKGSEKKECMSDVNKCIKGIKGCQKVCKPPKPAK